MTLKELETEKAKSLNEAAAAKDAAGVEALRIAYLGRNGSIPAIIKGMKDVPKEERPAFGKAVQAWRAEVEAALAAKGQGAAATDARAPARTLRQAPLPTWTPRCPAAGPRPARPTRSAA